MIESNLSQPKTNRAYFNFGDVFLLLQFLIYIFIIEISLQSIL